MPRLVLPASKHVLYPMGERAILLTEEGSAEAGNAIKLLRFVGVESDTISLDKFLSCLSGFSGGYDGSKSSGRARIVCSADVFDQLIETIDQDAALSHRWQEGVHSVFVYSSADRQKLQRLARRLAQDGAVIDDLPPGPTEFEVTNRFDGF